MFEQLTTVIRNEHIKVYRYLTLYILALNHKLVVQHKWIYVSMLSDSIELFICKSVICKNGIYCY